MEDNHPPRYGLTYSTEPWPECSKHTFAWFQLLIDALTAQPRFGDVRVIDLCEGRLL